MPERWSIFIDETGTFQNDDPSFVVGLLVESSSRELDSVLLRQELCRIWAPGPWPPHASTLKIPSSRVLHALCAQHQPQRMDCGPYVGLLRRPVAALVETLERSRFKHLVGTIRENGHWRYQDLREIDVFLRQEPAYRALLRGCAAQERAMKALVARLVRRLGEAQVTIVAMAGDQEPPGPAPQGLAIREEPYSRALRASCRRLLRLSSDQDIEAWVLTRPVEVGALGGRLLLQGALLKPLFEFVIQETGSGAQLRPGGTVLRYRDTPSQLGTPLHPLLVVADWMANHFRSHARHHERSYLDLAELLVRNHVLPSPRAMYRTPASVPGLGPLPTAGAAGAPERRIEACFQKQQAPPLGFALPWIWEQTETWVQAAQRWP